MKTLPTRKIRRSLTRLSEFVDDLDISDENTFDDRLNLLMSHCKSDAIVSRIHDQWMSMPGADFGAWHRGVCATVKSGPGSGKLTFPPNLDQRLALIYQLLGRIAAGEMVLADFVRDFFANVDDDSDSIVDVFKGAVVDPWCRELRHRIEEAEEDLPDDDDEEWPLEKINIARGG